MVKIMRTSARELKNRPQNCEAGLAVFIRQFRTPFEEGIIRAERRGLVVASSKEIHNALMGEDRHKIINGIACHSGTVCGFLEPGERFGRILEHKNPRTGWRRIMHVPEQYRGEKDCVLVGEHPDYEIHVDMKSRVTEIGGRLELVERFPPADGFYFGDQLHDLPQGKKVDVADRNERTRLLYREGAWVGPVMVGHIPWLAVLMDQEARFDEWEPLRAGMIIKRTADYEGGAGPSRLFRKVSSF